MNAETERKLIALAEEYEHHGPGAVYAVLQILQDMYRRGRHNEFARYCAAFPQIEGVTFTAGMEAKRAMPGDEVASSPEKKPTIH